MRAVGLEQPADSPDNLAFPDSGGAPSGALDAISALATHWNDLPDAVKASIRQLINEAERQPENS
jgi:hypothetical protein